MARTNTKQLTLHFTGDQTRMLDTIRDEAKKAFRTTEQQALFMLNNMLTPPDVAAEPFDPEELLHQPALAVSAEELDEAFAAPQTNIPVKKEVA